MLLGILTDFMQIMQTFPPTIVWRHRKENLKKCSLFGLESRADFCFFSYPHEKLPSLDGYILLAVDAPPLEMDDHIHGLLVLDGTWRYANKMLQSLYQPPVEGIIQRSIPGHYRTAYPRRQEDCFDPERGLSSIEAIFIAYHILGRNTEGLLERYHWRSQFFQKNPNLNG